MWSRRWRRGLDSAKRVATLIYALFAHNDRRAGVLGEVERVFIARPDDGCMAGCQEQCSDYATHRAVCGAACSAPRRQRSETAELASLTFNSASARLWRRRFQLWLMLRERSLKVKGPRLV